MNPKAENIKVHKASWPADDQPFRNESAPIRLTTKARRIPTWTLNSRGAINEVVQQPVRSSEPDETVTLIPMGAARLRISAFPVISNSPGAHDWPEAPHAAFNGSASHTYEGDTVDALSDGLIPKSSSDGSIPRFTWWPQRGSVEWVEYDFPKARSVSSVEVYWFDDAPNGGCRSPKSWTLLYKDGDVWKPVETTTAPGTSLNTFNKVSFKSVKTSALRIEAQLAPTFSSGILEWKITE